MKDRCLSLLLAVACGVAVQAKVYTIHDLAQFPGTGITADENGVCTVEMESTKKDTSYFDEERIAVTRNQIIIREGNSFKLEDGDLIVFKQGGRITIEGDIDADLAIGARLTAAEGAEGKVAGLRMSGTGHVANVRNVTFEYVGLDNSCEDSQVIVHNCTFKYHNRYHGLGAIRFMRHNHGNVIEDCNFIDCVGAAVNVGINVPGGLIVRNNIIERNVSSADPLPSISVAAGGDEEIIIENNRVIGPGTVTQAGGINVNNTFNNPITRPVIVRNNYVEGNYYGIGVNENSYVIVENNTIVNNNVIYTTGKGGYGVYCYNPTPMDCNAIFTGNHIEGNAVGIYIRYRGENLNIGKTDDPTAPDYNPGKNVFVNNGRDGVLCDLWNDTPDNVYAQGNTWNVAEQTPELIETVIKHKTDDNTLGEVYFMPPNTDFVNVTEVLIENEDDADDTYYNILGQPVAHPSHGIYIVGGKKVFIP